MNEIYFSPDRKTSSWLFYEETCRVQTSNPKVAKRIQTWSFAIQVGEGWNCPIWIFSIPLRKWRWVLKTLGMRLPRKNPNRVLAGRKWIGNLLKGGTGARVTKKKFTLGRKKNGNSRRALKKIK